MKCRDIKELSLTYNNKIKHSVSEGVAVVAVPVYAGRVPQLFLERFKNITGSDIPAVIAAVYGNRHYDDCLLELKDICRKQGFNIIAAGAFIAEHTYSNTDMPIAYGRPDADDLKSAFDLGRKTAEKLKNKNYSEPEIPGNYPYRDGMSASEIIPETDSDKCVMCGKCIEVCPAGIVKKKSRIYTEAGNCILCSACIKNCPVQARTFSHPKIQETRRRLFENFSDYRYPEIFL